jgi:hypothetical protein
MAAQVFAGFLKARLQISAALSQNANKQMTKLLLRFDTPRPQTGVRAFLTRDVEQHEAQQPAFILEEWIGAAAGVGLWQITRSRRRR